MSDWVRGARAACARWAVVWFAPVVVVSALGGTAEARPESDSDGEARAHFESGLLHFERGEYDKALPGWNREDVGGSPYAITDYRVPRKLGGESGLRTFRRQLHRRSPRPTRSSRSS